MRFTLNGQQLDLTAADVRRKRGRCQPRTLHQYACPRCTPLLYPVSRHSRWRQHHATRVHHRSGAAALRRAGLRDRRYRAAARSETPGGGANAGESASPVTNQFAVKVTGTRRRGCRRWLSSHLVVKGGISCGGPTRRRVNGSSICSRHRYSASPHALGRTASSFATPYRVISDSTIFADSLIASVSARLSRPDGAQ